MVIVNNYILDYKRRGNHYYSVLIPRELERLRLKVARAKIRWENAEKGYEEALEYRNKMRKLYKQLLKEENDLNAKINGES